MRATHYNQHLFYLTSLTWRTFKETSTFVWVTDAWLIYTSKILKSCRVWHDKYLEWECLNTWEWTTKYNKSRPFSVSPRFLNGRSKLRTKLYPFFIVFTEVLVLTCLRMYLSNIIHMQIFFFFSWIFKENL